MTQAQENDTPAIVEIPEIPRAPDVRLDPQTTALIIVDMQNDFAHPDGTLYGAETPTAIPAIARLLAKARRSGARVLFTQDWHGEDDPEFGIWGEVTTSDAISFA